MIDIDIKNQLNSRTSKVLKFIKKNPGCNMKNISNETGIDYNFVSKIVMRCEEEKMVKTKMNNREKIITLENKGVKITTLLEEVEKLL